MATLWQGRFKADVNELADDFNSSIAIDRRMYKEDIIGSIAHARMLGRCGIIPIADVDAVISGLEGILADINSGKLSIDSKAEDIHTFVEQVLTERIGEAGKKLHTARSRNDQCATDTRLYIKAELHAVKTALYEFIKTLVQAAEQYADCVMPGYTHMQRAQPVTFGHHLLAYCSMFLRDISRIKDCLLRTSVLPLGAGALAGTTWPINREMVREELGFCKIAENSMDAVSDRDYIAETSFVMSLIMMHLSRLSEEIALWCSWEFRFIELSDAYSTGSSIMPQKKNPDMAELIRGKTGRVYGSLTAILTMLKGLPLSYNKDMQEDKELVFEAIDTVLQCLPIAGGMIGTMKVNRENMSRAAASGFINATDCADYLTGKGIPFRTAYKITGQIVAFCIDNGKTLETLTIDEYHTFSDAFSDDIYSAIDLQVCVARRISEGGTSPESVRKQILSVYEECTDG